MGAERSICIFFAGYLGGFGDIFHGWWVFGGIGIRRFVFTSIPMAYLGKQNRGFSLFLSFSIHRWSKISIKTSSVSHSWRGLCCMHHYFSFTAVGKQWHWKLCQTYSYVERYIRSSVQRYQSSPMILTIAYALACFYCVLMIEV